MSKMVLTFRMEDMDDSAAVKINFDTFAPALGYWKGPLKWRIQSKKAM